MLDNCRVRIDAARVQKNREPVYDTIVADTVKQRAAVKEKEGKRVDDSKLAKWTARAGGAAGAQRGSDCGSDDDGRSTGADGHGMSHGSAAVGVKEGQTVQKELVAVR